MGRCTEPRAAKCAFIEYCSDILRFCKIEIDEQRILVLLPVQFLPIPVSPGDRVDRFGRRLAMFSLCHGIALTNVALHTAIECIVMDGKRPCRVMWVPRGPLHESLVSRLKSAGFADIVRLEGFALRTER